MANVVDAFLPGQAGHGGHRNQLTAAVAHHQGRRSRADVVAAIQLKHDGADLTIVESVVDVAAAEGGADLAQCCSVVEVESGELVAVQLQSPTGETGIKACAHPFKAFRRLRRFNELLGDTPELLQAELTPAAVQQFKRES